SDQVRDAIAGLKPLLPQNDTTLQDAQQKAAKLLVVRTADMRGQKRFDEAKRLLASAERFAPGLDALATEKKLVADEEAKWKVENEARERVARIDGLKQTFLARAKADDTNAAREALGELRKQLPANDEFLVTTAPQAFTDAYLRLARGFFD